MTLLEKDQVIRSEGVRAVLNIGALRMLILVLKKERKKISWIG